MKLNKFLTTLLAASTVLTLAACGNQSTSSSAKHDEATSSQVSKSKHHKKNAAKKEAQSESSSSQQVSSSSSSSQQGGNSQVNNQQASMSENDARDLLKTHLGMQRDAAGQNGQSMPVQPTADAIDGFTAKQNGNGWTISGSYNGKTYSYQVSPNGVTAE